AHPPHCPEPQGQRQAAVLKDRSRSHRNLAMTPRALPQPIRRRPRLPPATARALEAIRPAQLRQIPPAGLLGRKPGLQFQQVSRIVLHDPKHYRLWPPESSKYPSIRNEVPMKRVLLAAVLISAIQLISQTASEPISAKPKVRAITGFVRLDPLNYQSQVGDVL